MTDDTQKSIRPIPHNPNLDLYEGEWVMTRYGEVVAHAPTSTQLVHNFRALNLDPRECVMEFSHPPSKSWQVW